MAYEERYATRKITVDKAGGSLTVEGLVHGVRDSVEALPFLPLLGSLFPGTNFRLESYSIEEMDSRDGPPANWAVNTSLTYKSPDKQSQDEDGSESLDFGTAQEHVIKTRHPDDQTHHETDYGPYVGVSNDDIEGVDILVPTQAFSVTRYRDAITDAYRRLVRNTIRHVNDGNFWGYAPRTLLFVGATANRRGLGKWEVTYNFQVASDDEDETEIPLQVAIPDPANLQKIKLVDKPAVHKDPWDYLWFYSKQHEDPDIHILASFVDSAHVARFYFEADFDLLGIAP
jgi:hypothetical protein